MGGLTYVSVGLHLVEDAGAATELVQTLQATVLVIRTVVELPNYRKACFVKRCIG